MDLLKVTDHMNRYPLTFSADMPVEMAVHRLVDNVQTGGPVTDGNNKIIGFISEQDCLAIMLSGTYHAQQVAHVCDVMKTDVLTVKAYDCIVDLAQTMLQAKPKIYPVVDDDGYLIGVINRSDVLKAIEHELRSHYRFAG